MTDQELVKLSLLQICERAGFDASQRLTQRDLEFLCDAIEEKTNVLISLSTMKRLINGQFSRLPQVATLNAISNYLGYSSWQEYKVEQEKKMEQKPATIKVETPSIESVQIAQPARPVRKPSLRYKIAGAIAVVLVIVVILASKTLSSHPVINADKAVFSARKTTVNDLPNSVVFHYNIDDLPGDSFFIQQSWDRNRRVRIHKKAYTITDIYYEPGYHKAKLIVNDQVVKTVDVSIPTKGWFLYASKYEKGSVPIYIPKERIANNGIMGLTKEEVVDHHVEIGAEQRYCHTFFPGKFNVPSDNFILKARMRVVKLNNLGCPMLMAEVFTQQNFIFFRSSVKGCTSSIDALFGENYLDGKTTDLSGLGCEITEWQDYEMEVKNRHATVRINGKPVLTAQYKQDMGMIAGLGFTSNGLIEIDYAHLTGLDGTVVFSDDFNR